MTSHCHIQVTRIELALANATLLNITAASNPHLWKAALVSILLSCWVLHVAVISPCCVDRESV